MCRLLLIKRKFEKKSPHQLHELKTFNDGYVSLCCMQDSRQTETACLSVRWLFLMVNATCPLCQLEDEDTLHFLIKCNALYAYRKESMKELKDIISDIDESVWRILSNDFNLLTNVILEPDILIRRNLLKCNDEIFSKIENCTRRLCYALHCGRLHITNSGMSKNQFS